jgi:hypothetical protein
MFTLQEMIADGTLWPPGARLVVLVTALIARSSASLGILSVASAQQTTCSAS